MKTEIFPILMKCVPVKLLTSFSHDYRDKLLSLKYIVISKCTVSSNTDSIFYTDHLNWMGSISRDARSSNSACNLHIWVWSPNSSWTQITHRLVSKVKLSHVIIHPASGWNNVKNKHIHRHLLCIEAANCIKISNFVKTCGQKMPIL